MKAESCSIRVLLAADGHSAALRKRLDELEDIEIVGMASDGEEAIQLTCFLQPDVVLMDRFIPALGGIARAMCSNFM